MSTKTKFFLAFLTATIASTTYASIHHENYHPVYKTITKGDKVIADSDALKYAQQLAESNQMRHNSKTQNTEEDYKQVTIKYNYDPELYHSPYMVDLFNVETQDEYVDFFFEEPGTILEVVPGTYMTHTCFTPKNGLPQRIVIKESIVIENDTTIIFDPEEATNLQEHIIYTHNGDPIQLGMSKRYNKEPWMEEISKGNVRLATVSTAIYYENQEIIDLLSSTDFDYIEENGDTTSTMGVLSYYINDVSEKVKALSFGATFSNDLSSIDVFLYENKSQSCPNTYINNPDDFVLFDNSNSIPPYDAMEQGFGAAYQLNGEAGYQFTVNAIENSDIKQYYIGKTNSTILHNSEIFVIPSRLEYKDMDNWGLYYSFLTPVYNQDGVLVNTIYPYSGGEMLYVRNTYNGYTITPHPYFSFQYDKQAGRAFDNVPVLVSTNSFFAAEEIWNARISFEFSYIGNYGEKSDLGKWLGSVEYKKNGEVIATNTQEMQEFQWGLYETGIENAWGEYEINVIYPMTVDDIEGGNTTTMKFSFYNGVDVNSPTIQMLQLRKEDGSVTTRFDEGESILLSVAGGDYIYEKTHKYVPAAIKVEYSPYKADLWQEVNVKANPDLLDVPGMGDTYQGFIEPKTKSSNNWYDLRITVVDTAGNSQQQTLTAAFKVDSAVGIRTIEQTDVNNIYTLQGQKAQKQLNELGAGMYVVGGKKVVKM